MSVLLIKKNLSIACLLSISFLFTLKYASRHIEYALLIAILITGLSSIFLYYKKQIGLFEKRPRVISYGLVLIFVGLATYVFSKINVHDLMVDRWSVISSFWEAAFAGDYPYSAKSHLGNPPGPMPVYHLLALPFYLLGELGYFSLLGLLILVFLIQKRPGAKTYKICLLLFLVSAPFYLWEVSTRSNIFTTGILIVWVLSAFLFRKKYSGWLWFLNAMALGLLLSTRAIFSIPYIIVFMYTLRNKEVNLVQLSKYLGVAVLAFSASFLPLILTYPDQFFELNPFIIQSTFLIPFSYTLLFLAMAFVASFWVRSKQDVFFWSGLVLYASIGIYMFYNLYHRGLDEFFNGEYADLSYFIFCVPFFLWYLLENFLITQESDI